MDKQTVVHPYNGTSFRNKRNELSNHERPWRNHKCMLLSERNLKIYCMISTVQCSGKGKTMEIVKRLVVARDWLRMKR